jgi:mRNA-degrading endonuclease RelE of RelBE toxin-antitoxin system
MSYRIVPTPNFKKEAKRLKRKYPSLKNDLDALGNMLLISPTSGVHLGNGVHKIRMAIKSKGKGKRGGARVLTQVKIVKEVIYFQYIVKEKKMIYQMRKLGNY